MELVDSVENTLGYSVRENLLVLLENLAAEKERKKEKTGNKKLVDVEMHTKLYVACSSDLIPVKESSKRKLKLKKKKKIVNEGINLKNQKFE